MSAENGPMLTPRDVWDRAAEFYGGDDGRADALIRAARAVFADLQATIDGLVAQLDAYQGRTVMFCLDAHLDEAAGQSPDAGPGTILRATDTGRELERTSGGWRER